MTMQFKPPIARQLGMRDMFKFGPKDDPFWQRVRHSQLEYAERYLPMSAPVAVLNGAVAFTTFGRSLDHWVLVYWLVTQLGSIAFGVLKQRQRSQQPLHILTSPRDHAMSLTNLLASGSGWAVLFQQSLLQAGPADAMLIVAMAIAAIGCFAFSTATWPLASLATSGTVALGTIAGILSNSWAESWVVVLVMCSFVAFVARGNLLTARSFLIGLEIKERLQEQEEVARLLLNEFETNGSEWLFEVDAAGCLTFASSRFAEAVRRPVHEVIGQHWSAFLSTQVTDMDLRDFGLPFRDWLVPAEIEGETRWWTMSGTPKIGRSGKITGYRGVGLDVTDRQRSAERIAELATYDALTGLSNRRIVHQTLSEGLEAEGGVALLFVDLDRFKSVNDSLGHAAGDRLLSEVARRLQAIAGGAGTLVGRLGGDEFAVVLRPGDQAEAERVGEAIIAELSRPYQIGDNVALIGASVGLAIGPADGANVEALMRAADLALYDVKAKGRGNVRHYDRAMHKRSEERRSLELDLRNALGNNQLRLAFQPVVDAIDERVIGFEALLRWRHPTLGEISPADFIPVAEECGIIGSIGAWVLNEACRVATGWPRNIKIAVNLSPLQFDDPNLVETVRQTLQRWKITPSRLELELTESLFLDERPQTAQMLAELHELGVGFALDDFGTGYSSLGYLQKIHFRRIKIDRSFVQGASADSGESTAIIQAIVALADRLGMETTAEGTETRAEFETMRRLGCAHIQGYYFGRPMPPEDAARLIDRNRPMVVISDEPEEAGAHVQSMEQLLDQWAWPVPGASVAATPGTLVSQPQPRWRAASARSPGAGAHPRDRFLPTPTVPRRG